MRKFLILATVSIASLGLAACGQKAEESATTEAVAPSEVEADANATSEGADVNMTAGNAADGAADSNASEGAANATGDNPSSSGIQPATDN